MRYAGVVVALALAGSRVVLAHEGEQHAARDPAGPVVLFVAGVVVLGASTYFDRKGAVSRRFADAGVILGLLAVVAAIPLYWL